LLVDIRSAIWLAGTKEQYDELKQCIVRYGRGCCNNMFFRLADGSGKPWADYNSFFGGAGDSPKKPLLLPPGSHIVGVDR